MLVEPDSKLSQLAEDKALFPKALQSLVVVLLPKIVRDSKGNIVFDAFLVDANSQKQSISVVFAGRRRKTAEPLRKHLWKLKDHMAEGRARGFRNLPDVRMPIYAHGCLIRRYIDEPDGWKERSHQLNVAQWSVPDKNGNPLIYGAPALNHPAT